MLKIKHSDGVRALIFPKTRNATRYQKTAAETFRKRPSVFASGSCFDVGCVSGMNTLHLRCFEQK